MDLNSIRQEIDQIDQELVALLEKRMVCVGQIVEYKEQKGLPVLDQGREREVLEKVDSLVMDEQYRTTIQAQFQDMMKHSRTYQEEVRARD
ncbi:chorismate mutase [Streptococcus downii]|uniref:Chorismate mutase n=1 Tax=Streptococcus downii TaxID=1968889 RepID=A0ABW0XZP6_9STRE|nr:chorismate mutase [Streptococcus downii]